MAYNNPSFQILPPKAPSTAASVMKILDETMQRRKAEEERNAAASAKIFLENSKGRYGDDYTAEYEKWAADPQNSRAVRNYGSGMATAPVESAQDMYQRTKAENLMGAEKVLDDPNASLDQWIGAYRRAYGANPPSEVVMSEALRRTDPNDPSILEAIHIKYGMKPNANTKARIELSKLLKEMDIASKEHIAKGNQAIGWERVQNQREGLGIQRQNYEVRKAMLLNNIPGQFKPQYVSLVEQLEDDAGWITYYQQEMTGELDEKKRIEMQEKLNQRMAWKTARSRQLADLTERALSSWDSLFPQSYGPPPPYGR